MGIINCFPYFNEKELLELRINLLQDKVDKFIITDANKTHKGDPKPFSCRDTLLELGLLSDKILVVEVDLPSYEEDPNPWVRERVQRNIASQYIQDDDVCIVSDCDEIINPDLIDYYAYVARQYPQNILRIPLVFLMGKANLKVCDRNDNPIPWNSSFMCLKTHLKKYTLSDIRESHALSTNHIEYSDIFITDEGKVNIAGWHFSWMGDQSRLKTKCESFLHWNEVSVQENYVAKENEIDCLGRNDYILKKYPISLLPSEVFELERVRNFLFFENNKESILKEVGEKNYFNWEGHKTFAEWLVHQTNPNVIVDLGVDYGYSTFCFALPKIGKVYGIDCFEGDEWAGSRNTYNYVLQKKEELELDNITFIKGYFDDVFKTWDKKIDVLHIDGFHSYESVKSDFEKWSSFVNDNGVILFHDTMVDDPRFGVKKFFQEIDMPKTNFYNSNGLGIVSKNKEVIDEIKSKFSNLIFELDNEENVQSKKSLMSVLEENPFLITDKNTVCYKKYPEKWTWLQYHSYVENFYDDAFKEYQNKEGVKVCEIGIDVGGSIALWSKYFDKGNIVGIDISTDRLNDQYKQEKFNNVQHLIENAYDEKFIDSLPTFDIIIDDGPHTLETMLIFVEKYLDKLNPGGLLVIEDIPEIKWIDYFKLLVPKGLETQVVDLRSIDDRYDSLIFAVKK